MARDGREREIAQELGRLAHALSNDVALALAALELLQEQGEVPAPALDSLAGAVAALQRASDHLGALRTLRDGLLAAPDPSVPLIPS